ncbi:MAG TPA: YceH family protein [Thermoanaerobaculia bacterium]|jgi:hypothetical protein|nr:YceH family protein [Thermoanaerobaculia bacterium]
MSTRIPRQLTAVEVRVLGTLLEKEQTTPEACPLSVNALLAGCNQKTNREPVMDLTEGQVVDALEQLRRDVLVWRSESARAERWQQSVVRRWGLDRAGKALMTLLLLRGPQTAGELRTRSERMNPFASVDDVEQALRQMAAIDEPLVAELARRPGQKETRWTHLVGDIPEPQHVELAEPPLLAGQSARSGVSSGPSLAQRVETLEETVRRLSADLEELKALLS